MASAAVTASGTEPLKTTLPFAAASTSRSSLGNSSFRARRTFDRSGTTSSFALQIVRPKSSMTKTAVRPSSWPKTSISCSVTTWYPATFGDEMNAVFMGRVSLTLMAAPMFSSSVSSAPSTVACDHTSDPSPSHKPAARKRTALFIVHTRRSTGLPPRQSFAAARFRETQRFRRSSSAQETPG